MFHKDKSDYKKIENKLHPSYLLCLFMAILVFFCGCRSAPEEINTFCNPINIDYQFNIHSTWFTGRNLWREAADPVIVFYKGDYYLFASKAGGYWYSNDMSAWTLVEPEGLPIEDYAPTAFVIGDRMFFTAMRSNRVIYSTDNPKKGIWKKAAEIGPYMLDPALFLDDNGKVYLYYGGSPNGPIYGAELDPDNNFQTMGEPFACLYGDHKNRGWECRGDDNMGISRRDRLEITPWIEGAWMTKHQGVYYLQYAAPGTEFKTYADGVFTSDNPRGPFTYAPYSPFSHKPTGFVPGAGHGGIFKDKYGNYWKVATMMVSAASDVDRRVGIFPVDFDDDDHIRADTYLGDYPQYLPRARKKTANSNFAGNNLARLMLLSYGKKVKASSRSRSLPAELAVDEDVKTYWSASTGRKGEWLEIDLGKTCRICALQVNFAEHKIFAFGRMFYHQYLIEVSPDSKNWVAVVDKTNARKDVPHDYIELTKPVQGRFVRLTNIYSPGQGKFSVRDLRVFGNGLGRQPDPVNDFVVQRNLQDQRRAVVKWEKVQGADGYIVRYGILPDKLYNNYQIYRENSIPINSLNADGDYFFTVDSFNDSGITRSKIIKKAKSTHTGDL